MIILHSDRARREYQMLLLFEQNRIIPKWKMCSRNIALYTLRSKQGSRFTGAPC